MNEPPRPRFLELAPERALEILSRNHVGRVAVARDQRVDIEPLHYVYDDGWLYGRTSEGTKIHMTGREWWPVAFEVDEIDGVFDWRSVVVHGGFYVLKEDDPHNAEARDHAIALLRTLIPDTLTEDDPTPARTVLFRISVQEMRGREARSY
ncbi:MAG: pyridoxamine 5'-phosphate oxidase family protein [Gemmatimonadota bacterium]